MSQFIYTENSPIDELNTEGILKSLQNLSPEDWHRLKQDKEKFLHNYSEYPGYCNQIYPSIAQSWVKSRISGVNIQPEVLERPFLSLEELQSIQEKNHSLIEHTKSLFTVIKNEMLFYEYTLHLFDQNGILILTESTVPKYSPTLSPAQGTIWNEESVGTNVFSLTRQTKAPNVLPGLLHYSDIFNNLICSAAPIRNEDAEIIGVLAIIEPLTQNPWEISFQKEVGQALGLITAMAAAIENILKLANEKETQNAIHSKLKVTFNLIDGGIVSIDHTGKIISTNQVACQMFKQEADLLIGRSITEFLNIESHLIDQVKRGQKIELEESICIGRNKQPYRISVHPVMNEYTNKIDGAILRINHTRDKSILTNKSGFTTRFSFENMIGESREFCKAIELGKTFSNSSENVLIIGESGTGKELFAQAIHNRQSPNGPFIAVNCAAMPRNLIESELFGYEGGSFTGADRSGRPGKIELANGGTLFLDEIGDMPLELQAVLLRVLEDKQVMRVGGHRYKPINFRLIAATNKDLRRMVEEGQFRADLYYRLTVLNINLPSLRQRGNDVEILTYYFIEKYCSKLEKQALPISASALKKIKEYNWPGNVRQLENAIICAVNTEKGDIIEPESLPAYIDLDKILQIDDMNDLEIICKRMGGRFSLMNWEQTALKAALVASNNYIPLAADLLKISRSTMYRKLKLFDIDLDAK